MGEYEYGNGRTRPSPHQYSDATRPGLKRIAVSPLARSGDQRRLFWEELVNRFFPSRETWRDRIRGRPGNVDDLLQVASLGLVKAIDRSKSARSRPSRRSRCRRFFGEPRRYSVIRLVGPVPGGRPGSRH